MNPYNRTVFKVKNKIGKVVRQFTGYLEAMTYAEQDDSYTVWKVEYVTRQTKMKG